MFGNAAYTAERAAALAGVPKSTIHYWAREGILVPSVSPERVKLWSFTDLMALRMIDWLRREKSSDEGKIAATTMRVIRRALKSLAQLDLDMFTDEGAPSIRVDRSGAVYILHDKAVVVEARAPLQLLHGEFLDLTAPVVLAEGQRGPDLRAPRPRLRIVPGKLAGAPHVLHTRVETQALAALANRQISVDIIHELYPMLERPAIEEALDLEAQLQRNLAAAA